MATEIIGNKKYNDMKPQDRRYINGTNSEILALAERLYAENIEFSGRINGYKDVLTVDTEYSYNRAVEILQELRTQNKTEFIGNTPFKYFGRNNRTIVTESTDTMKAVAERFNRENVKYSGVITGNTTKITVFLNDADRLKRYIEETKNTDIIAKLTKMNFNYFSSADGISIKNIITGEEKSYNNNEELRKALNNTTDDFLYPTAYKISLTSDAYTDTYYISEYNPNTEEEKAMLYDIDGWTLTFTAVDDAVNYAQNKGISLTNPSAEISEWRSYEAESVKAAIAERSKEYTAQLQENEDHFVFNDNNTVTWTYFNPDGNNGNGQFVEHTITENDIIEAYENRINTANEFDGRRNFFESLYSSCYTELIDADTEEFIPYAQSFIDEVTSEKTVIINNISGDYSYDEHADIISRLEASSEAVVEAEKKRTEIEYSTQLIEKAEREFNDFTASITTTAEAIDRAYEISMKKEILVYFNELEEEEAKLIFTAYENPLDTVYQEWLSNDYNSLSDDISVTFTDVVNSIRGAAEKEDIIENNTFTVENSTGLTKAKAYIEQYIENERLGEVDYNDLKHIAIAYSTGGENNEYEIQVEADLVNFEIRYIIDGQNVAKTEKYESLAEMNYNALSVMEYNDLISEGSSYIQSIDDILYDVKKASLEKHRTEPTISDGFDNNYFPFPNRINPIGSTPEGSFYADYESVLQIKFSGMEWMSADEAEIQINHNAVSIDDIEMLNIRYVTADGTAGEKDVTPEQYAIYCQRLVDRPQAFKTAVGRYAERNINAVVNDYITNYLPQIIRSVNAHDEMEDLVNETATDKINDSNYAIEIAKKHLYLNSFQIPEEMFDNLKRELDFLNLSADNINVGVHPIANDSGVEFTYRGTNTFVDWNVVSSACIDAAENYSANEHQGVLDAVSRYFKSNSDEERSTINSITREEFIQWAANELANYTYIQNSHSDDAKFRYEIRDGIYTLIDGFMRGEEHIKDYAIADFERLFDSIYADSADWESIIYNITQNVDDAVTQLEIAKEIADRNDIPFSASFSEGIDDSEDIYAPDGSMSFDDYEKMHKSIDADRFEIYQMKATEENHLKIFEGLDRNPNPDISDYELVYTGNLSDLHDSSLDGIFRTFNIDRPDDFTGRSLSVSDVVALHNDGDKFYYVDSFGFAEVPDFAKSKSHKKNSPTGNYTPDEEEVVITQADIDVLRTLPPRKSVLNFTEEEKSATLRWAARFKADIGEKSPYFRADNEWRDSEETQISTIEVKNINSTLKSVRDAIKNGDIFRGTIVNTDTNWQIQVSRNGLEDSVHYANKHNDSATLDTIYSIENLLKSAVLLDSIVTDDNNSTKANNTAFMHKLYNICKINNEHYIVKFTVEEFLNAKENTLKRMYNVQDIKIEPLRHVEFTNNQLAPSVLNGSKISIADLFGIVKACDKDFYMNSPDYALAHGEQAAVDVKPEFTPVTVTCEFSESLAFESGRTYTVAEFDRIMKEADAEKCEGWENGIEEYGSAEDFEREDKDRFYKYFGYDKTEFTINLPNGDKITERQDIGDGYGGFIDFLKQFPKFAAVVEIVEAQRDLDNAIRERDEQKEKTETIKIDHNTIEDQSNGLNFRIPDDNFNAEGGAKTRFRNNVEAVKLLKKIEAEGRTATADEQNVLAKYVGWGGISQAFDSGNEQWKNEYEELAELLDKEEYANARASVLDAYYTSPVVIEAMYNALENMGFNGGKILEPSMGTGNFFGSMPESLADKSQLTGVEIDSISGRIAKQLYQTADINIKPYQHTHFSDNEFDVAIGNVPFGDSKPYDKNYSKNNFNIHDYFFAKTLDKVHEGGIVAFVTSQGTLDKKSSEVRKYIAERAELLGAIRLPNNAFKGIAGTDVTSDIIFLQKRERPIAINNDTVNWLNRGTLDNGIVVNNYFVEHPEMILGEMVEGNKMYGSGTMCKPIEGSNLKEQLAEAIKNITGTYQQGKTEKKKNEEINRIDAPPDVKTFSYAVYENKLYYREDDTTMAEVTGKQAERCKDMVGIRDAVKNLLDMQINNINGDFTDDIAEKRAELNVRYDNFVEKYGYLNEKANINAFNADASYHLLKSLEIMDSDNNFIRKADIFTKNTIKPITIAEKVDNAHDALILSLSEKLKVDFDFMQKISGMSEQQLISDLQSEIYQNPEKNMEWESADEYLTGNVRHKLAAAEAAGLEHNAEMLRAVMPETIEAQDISIKLGAAWIDPEYVRQFIIEEFRPDYQTRCKLDVIYEPYSDTWGIEGCDNRSYYCIAANETYGRNDGRYNGYKIIEMALNNKKPQIYKDLIDQDTGKAVLDAKGNPVRVIDAQETAIIQNKQELVQKKFAEWIMNDPERRAELVNKYNEIFNSVRLREYDGSHLNFVGMNSEIELLPHQKNAVARALNSGNTLLAHEVGAGKTYEMIAIAMEGKRLGLHNKSLCAVPKHLTEQMGNAFRELYPNCNILVATEKDFEKSNRQELLAKIATNDYDAVIVGHSQFDRIRLSASKERDYVLDELDSLRAALDAQSNSDGKKSFTVKQIERTIKKFEKELAEIEDRSNTDDFIDFEQLGVDKLFIDESQYYKNLSVSTKMTNISGLGGEGSKKSLGLLMKCRYLDEITGNKGVVFASGTPISNSMTELYSLMRYLQSDKLNEMGLSSFDRWASVFGETKTEMELKPTANGEYQMKTRFAKFNNLPELMNLFKECADIKTAQSLNLPRPECERHLVNVPPSRFQKKYIKELGKRAEAIHIGEVDSHIDNMLKITTDGRKIGLDARCIDSNAPGDTNSKVNVCINNVFDIWQKTAEQKSTQLIFCDISTPQKPKNENTYTVFRKTSDGGYAPIYSAKLGKKDTLDTVFDKLANKPPKEFVEEIGVLRENDVIVTRNVSVEEETAYHNAASVVSGKLVPADNEMWDNLKIAPVTTFESEKRFCVYDDIKEKLINMGIPENEIAFIHDYEKQEDKLKLYDKMNKGEVRVMIGSTSKCGAGMNAQQKMIALHDLDAPMRPSDMGQRRGRIERQGNENAKVDIYRYTTDRTFDAYLYQMLENKQKFISQIMTEKSPVRSCDDIDEIVLDFAETKALCAGNPLIKERLDLQNAIQNLNILKSSYLTQKYSLQDKLVNYPAQKQAAEYTISKIEADIKLTHPLLEDADGKKYAPIVINGETYTDKEKGGEALRNLVEKNINQIYDGKEIEVGSYRGFKLSVLAADTFYFSETNLKLCLSGNSKHYCDMKLDSSINPSGNITRLNNAISNIEEKELVNAQESLQQLIRNHDKIQELIDVPFEHEAELAEKETRLAEVEQELMQTNLSDKTAECKDLYDALTALCPELKGSEDFRKHYEADGFEPLTIEKNGNEATIMHTYVQNGDLMYDPAITFTIDNENMMIDVVSYEQSDMAAYERYDKDNQELKNSCIEFFGEWLENIENQGFELSEKENMLDYDEPDIMLPERKDNLSL